MTRISATSCLFVFYNLNSHIISWHLCAMVICALFPYVSDSLCTSGSAVQLYLWLTLHFCFCCSSIFMTHFAVLLCLWLALYFWFCCSTMSTKKAKENWIGEQCSEIEENLRKNNSKRAYQLVKDLTTVKQGKATTVQDHSGKCLTEERQILNRWMEYCSELYNHKASGNPSVLNCTQTDTENGHPILCREVKAAVQSLKKGKSAGVDNIPAELVQAGG